MSRDTVLCSCREIRDASLPALVYGAGRYRLVNWLRDQLAMFYVKGHDPDWDIAIREVERVRGDWPSSLLDWQPPEGAEDPWSQ